MRKNRYPICRGSRCLYRNCLKSISVRNVRPLKRETLGNLIQLSLYNSRYFCRSLEYIETRGLLSRAHSSAFMHWSNFSHLLSFG